jgi:hypothetical protein
MAARGGMPGGASSWSILDLLLLVKLKVPPLSRPAGGEAAAEDMIVISRTARAVLDAPSEPE